ncbi:MAG: preprotein translocase subunit SecY [Clostridium sp.]|nr:preprotein translocase subunit SecY [Clostridium sp.]MCM1443823.1 preprotein translocase subunit SecY [Candidatus Amulumruptor caecigallinarius]
MFATIRQIFNRKNRDLQKRILFTFAALFIFKLGTSIIVPGIDQYALGTKGLEFFELLDIMGGGALSNFSIFALGVSPYITASIIIQLLEMDIVPYLAELRKQGGTGRAKLNQITRITGIALAFIQGFIFSFTFIEHGPVVDSAQIMQFLQFALVLTAGTCFVLWLGDQITAKGIGNGISIIIMAGIISSMPSMFEKAFTSLIGNSASITGILLFILYVIIYFAVIIGIIYVQSAERRIPVQYSTKTVSSAYGGNQNYIPFKLNSAGVVPVIFASVLISIPGIIAGFIKNNAFSTFVSKWLSITSSTGDISPTGIILYVVLIFAFSYFYTFLQIRPKEMAENLQKNGGYIAGIRPGEETADYITKVLKRLTVVGSIGLVIIAALPIVFGYVTKLDSSVTIGGTGLLIVVGVCLETYKQLESQVVSRNYKKGTRRY